MGAVRCHFLWEGLRTAPRTQRCSVSSILPWWRCPRQRLRFANGDQGSYSYFDIYSLHTVGETPCDLRQAAGASAFGRQAVHLNLALFSCPYPRSSVLQRPQGHTEVEGLNKMALISLEMPLGWAHLHPCNWLPGEARAAELPTWAQVPRECVLGSLRMPFRISHSRAQQIMPRAWHSPTILHPRRGPSGIFRRRERSWHV